MNRIRLLSEQVANQIAAGEVVERPASVVKELVENSLDADAHRVSVTIRSGGRSLVRVTDDGFGMSRDDALLALERHATSKISKAEDLQSIRSLGFRGEAIPSIAAVARFTLTTRERGQLGGTQIEIAGGKILAVKDVGTAEGTIIEVRNLFFNLPARRKFLRSEPTETAHIEHILTLCALAHPQVAFRFVNDDREVFDLAPTTKLFDRLRELYGAQLCEQLVAVSRECGSALPGATGSGLATISDRARKGAPTITPSEIRITGYVGKPGLSRADRNRQHIFVNGRPVDSKGINFALREAYHTALMRGQFPVTFLFVELDPASVDVNIHPAKREVRFRDERAVRDSVISAVRAALQPKGAIATPVSAVGWTPAEGRSFAPQSSGALPAPSDVASAASPASAAVPSGLPRPVPPGLTLRGEVAPAPVAHTMSLPVVEAAVPGGSVPRPVPGAVDSGLYKQTEISRAEIHTDEGAWRILGVIGRLYVLAESPEGLVMIDQHAAHERVLFEKMLKELTADSAPAQKLLLPVTLELDARDAEFLRSNLKTLHKLGIGVSEFGDKTFLIDALPPYFRLENLSQTMRHIVDELRQTGEQVHARRLGEDKIATTVCRHAVKAHDPLKGEELRALLQQLHRCDLPYTCPHGRPTMIQISYGELEKKFGRKV